MSNSLSEDNREFNLCIDQGNSRTKIGVFDGDNLLEVFTYEYFDVSVLIDLLNKFKIRSCIYSSVIDVDNEFLDFWTSKFKTFVFLTHNTLIPITNTYSTPQTLGKDRLAAVVGASFIKPNKDLLVIDAGTAITYDFITAEKIYLGGNIAPGIEMRLRALYEFTGKLPLVKASTESQLLGTDTQSAILSGVLQGMIFEIKGYIDIFKFKYPELLTLLTGGSTFYFDTKLKSPIFAEKNLVLIGLNCILQFNVKK